MPTRIRCQSLSSHSELAPLVIIVGISGFLSAGSVDGILLVLAVDYFIILLMTGVQSLMIDRFDHLAILRAMSLGFALVFALVLVFFSFDLDVPPRFNYALLYIIAEQQWLVFPPVFWVLAGDVFSMAQAKRLFPLVASFGFAGKLIGSILTGVSPSLSQRVGVTPVGVLGINVLIYLLALVILIVGFRNVRVRKRTPRAETVRQTVSEGWGFVREVPAFRYLAIALLALTFSDTIIEFRFLTETDAAFQTQATYQQFYSVYSFVTTIIVFIIQGFFASRIIGWLNLRNTFFVLPIAQFVGSIWMLGIPGVLSAVGAIVMQRVSRDAIDESARKALFLLVPGERRGRVSLFMDSYVPAVGTIVACGVTGLIIFIGKRLGFDTVFYIYRTYANQGETETMCE